MACLARSQATLHESAASRSLCRLTALLTRYCLVSRIILSIVQFRIFALCHPRQRSTLLPVYRPTSSFIFSGESNSLPHQPKHKATPHGKGSCKTCIAPSNLTPRPGGAKRIKIAVADSVAAPTALLFGYSVSVSHNQGTLTPCVPDMRQHALTWPTLFVRPQHSHGCQIKCQNCAMWCAIPIDPTC